MIILHSPFRLKLCVVAVLATLLCSGCASRGPHVKREVMVAFTPEQQQQLAAMNSSPYTLQRGDVFSVNFIYNKEYNQEQILVLPDGSASFFGIDQMYVAGLTIAKLDSLLTAVYAKQVLDPDLSIIVKTIGGRKVYVLGEVHSPGLFDIPGPGLSVLGAVAMAGGFTSWASKGSVVQIRVTPEGYLCRELSLTGIGNPNGFDPLMLELEPYDVIYVSRSWIGDFASFSREVVGALLQYTRLVLDVRIIEDPDAVFRR